MKTARFAIAAALALSTGAAASSIVPAEVYTFDPVNLRMTVDSCAFNASATRVTSMAENVIRVVSTRNQCLVAGTPQVADIRLGAFPPGSYRVEVFGNSSSPPEEVLRFEVRDRPEIAIFPPPPRPLTDYSGLWYNPAESGWGLSIHQGSDHVVFAILFIYGTQSQPEWYTIQGGQWSSATLWSGTVYRTTGPSYASSVFDPGAVMYAGWGTATIDFQQTPGREGIARIDYTINGVSATKFIERMPL